MKSGRWDSNPGPLTPHASALAGLRHAPISGVHYSRLFGIWQESGLISLFGDFSHGIEGRHKEHPLSFHPCLVIYLFEPVKLFFIQYTLQIILEH